MGISFLVCLFLAWPTYGLSLAGWLAVALFRGQRRIDRIGQRREKLVLLEPLFTNRFAEFFRALDLPLINGPIDDAAAHQGGRFIMNFVAQNPLQTEIFMKGLARWGDTGTGSVCHPVYAVNRERALGSYGPVHLVAYRAITSIQSNNPNVKCFDGIDCLLLTSRIIRMEFDER